MIVGLSGYARSGKDEAAKVLVEKFGFTRVAFADKLRECLYQLNPIVVELTNDGSVVDSQVQYLQDIISKYGWDGYKETEYGPEIRRLLQRMGTEVGRQTLWDSIWVDVAFREYDAGTLQDIVVTDVRFPNEAQAIKDRGGSLWRIRRLNVGPANDHPSETSLDDWPFDDVILNYGKLETFHDQIRVRARRKNESRV